jgi:predicted DNA-binding protein (MmcQ/YjbR family)
MKVSALRSHCASLPGAVREIKWSVDEVYTVGAKMFAHFGSVERSATAVMFKAGAERFLELTDRVGIEPAPYLARAHWVKVETASDLSDTQLEELLTHSHALVMAKLTRVQRDAIAVAPGRKPRRS